MSSRLVKMQDFALEAALAASNYILNKWKRHQSSIKNDGTILTEVDIEAEKIICTILRQNTPSIEIYGEELGNLNLNSERFWLIDPIDGTRWYHLGLPLFGTLIAYIEDGEPLLGLISLPVTQEIVYASQGSGCYYWKDNTKEKIICSTTETINMANISVSGLHGSDLCSKNASKPYRISRLPALAQGFYCAGDCVQHALVARGKLDAAIDTIMKPWDLAALIPCIKEAGGQVCSLEGKKDALLLENTLLSCASTELAQEIIDLLKP